MEHPGNGWTIAVTLLLVAWGTAGTVYTRHRLRPLREATARAMHQLALSRLSDDPLTKRVLLHKAQGTACSHRHVPCQLTRWHSRVYFPVMVALTVVVLTLAVWGVVTGAL